MDSKLVYLPAVVTYDTWHLAGCLAFRWHLIPISALMLLVMQPVCTLEPCCSAQAAALAAVLLGPAAAYLALHAKVVERCNLLNEDLHEAPLCCQHEVAARTRASSWQPFKLLLHLPAPPAAE